MAKSTLISASGKVLIAGGYLVLDPLYSGIVVSTSSRFYTQITDADGSNPNRIRVRSPQFVDATWDYTLEQSLGVSAASSKCVLCSVRSRAWSNWQSSARARTSLYTLHCRTPLVWPLS